MNLFVDSSGWIALFGKADKYHTIAQTAFKELKMQSLYWVTSDYVFDETVTFLRMKYGVETAVSCGNIILNAPYIDLIPINEIIWQESWQMFQTYKDKQWAFTDCTSFVLMRKEKLWQAFSFDEHFVQAGFQLWP